MNHLIDTLTLRAVAHNIEYAWQDGCLSVESAAARILRGIGQSDDPANIASAVAMWREIYKPYTLEGD